jgi:hypothetical protein
MLVRRDILRTINEIHTTFMSTRNQAGNAVKQ